MKPDPTPEFLSSIGLGLPGGGFRAASFTLGILSFLHKANLLQNVRGISTVSGGTITGAKYAEMCSKGKSFEEFYTTLHNWLLQDDLANRATENLRHPERFRFKHRNLINAFALEYQKFIPGTLQELDDGLKSEINTSGLQDVVFNATEFENGYIFRFKNFGKAGSHKSSSEIRDLIKSSQLGDIVAASSCFPGGFEPISFPGDFIPNQKAQNQIALMDGGILDNQGTSSFTTTDLKYDYYLIADAGSNEMPSFEFTEYKGTAKIVSQIFSWWALIIPLLASLALIHFEKYLWAIIPIVLTSVILVLQLGLESLLNLAKNKLSLKRELKLPRKEIGIYILNRLNSIVLMNNSVFLRGAKRNNITSFFEKDHDKISVLSIYELREGLKTDTSLGPPSAFVQSISEKATNYPTTLWFVDDEEKSKALNTLILCGEVICCYNLLKKMKRKKLEDHSLYKKLMEHWKNYNAMKEVNLSNWNSEYSGIKA